MQSTNSKGKAAATPKKNNSRKRTKAGGASKGPAKEQPKKTPPPPRPQPVKVEVVPQKSKPLFGPRSTIHEELEDNGGVSIVSQIDANMIRLKNGLLGIVAYCAQHAVAGNSNLNAAFAYRYLYDYLCSMWTRQTPVCQLEIAPPVYWDLCDAGTPKSGGWFQLSVATILGVLGDLDSTTMWNCTLGIPVEDSSTNYTGVSASLNGYTDQKGLYHASLLFQGVSSSVKVVSRKDYSPQIKSNDSSIYASVLNRPTEHSPHGIIAKNINNPLTQDPPTKVDIIAHHGGPVKTEWLYHFAIGTVDSNDLVYSHALPTSLFSTPASIAIHRLVNGLSGTERKNERVILKPVYIQEYARVFDSLWSIVDSYFDPTGTKKIFKQPGSVVTQDDATFMIQLLVSRYFSPWLAMGAGWAPCFFGGSGTGPFSVRAWNCGTGSCPARNHSSLLFPKVMVDMLARLQPFEKYLTSVEAKVFFYPIPCVYDSTLGLNSLNYAGSGGVFVGTWDLIKNNLGGTTTVDIAASETPALVQLVKNWQSAMRVASPFWEMSANHCKSDVNFGALSRYLLSQFTLQSDVGATVSDRIIPEEIGYLVERTILSQYTVAKAPLGMALRFLHCQKFMETESASAGKQFENVTNALIGSVHPLEGSLADFGASGSSNNNNEGSGLLKIAKDVAVGGIVAEGSRQLASRLGFGSLPEFLGHSFTGYQLLNRMRGAPQAFSIV